MSNNRRVAIRFTVLILCFLALTGCTQVPANFQSVLVNMSRSFPNIWRLATAVSYLLGFSLALKALYTLKIYGEARTMMSSNSNIKTPLMYLLVSTALIFLPTTFGSINLTFFNTPNMIGYTGGAKAGMTSGSIRAVVGVVQIVGLFAFIRGWLYVSRAGEQSGQPGTMAKGFTHIVGGLLAINIIQTKDVLWNTFGFG